MANTLTTRRSRDVPALVSAARSGDRRAVGRLLSLIEEDSPYLRPIAAALTPNTSKAHVIGLTGAPGVGKSTCTTALVAAYREQGKRVGVLAVDPSSPFTGGALLGDRIRMQEFATDPEVFIRSMASRGHLGGLASATPAALRLLEGIGCNVILIETVGVGQGEVEIASLADTTLVLLAPGMGDGVQAAKAGILEIADIYVVNKADHEGADLAVRDLKNMLALGGKHSQPGSWRPVIVKTVAVAALSGSATGPSGVAELIAAIEKHRDWLDSHDERTARRQRRAAAEIAAIALTSMRAQLETVPGNAGLPQLAEQVAAGELDPYTAADSLLKLRHVRR